MQVNEFLRMFLRMNFDKIRPIKVDTPAKIAINVLAEKIRSPKNNLRISFVFMTVMMNIFQGDVRVKFVEKVDVENQRVPKNKRGSKTIDWSSATGEDEEAVCDDHR